MYATRNENICSILGTLILNRLKKKTGIVSSLIHAPEMLFLTNLSDSGVQISVDRTISFTLSNCLTNFSTTFRIPI
jgi:hypothetical protein